MSEAKTKLSDPEALELAERQQKLVDKKAAEERAKNSFKAIPISKMRDVLKSQNDANLKRKVIKVLGSLPKGSNRGVIEEIEEDLSVPEEPEAKATDTKKTDTTKAGQKTGK